MSQVEGKLGEFTRRLLSMKGCDVEVIDKDLLGVRLGPDLRERLNRESLVLAFSQEVAASNQEAELVTPGSYFFAFLLLLARMSGDTCSSVAKEKVKNVTAFLRQVKFDKFNVEIVERESYHHAFVRFHFVVTYASVDSSHEIRSVVYDTSLKRASTEIDGFWDQLQLEKRPREETLTPALAKEELALALDRSCSFLAARIKHRVSALKARSSELLKRELERLESYYRRLIDEEVGLAGDAGSRSEGRPGKVESYKLEWQRKAATEALRFRPRVRISLMAVEEVWLPRSLLTLRIDTHPFTEFYGLFEHGTGIARGAFCQNCNNLSVSLRLDKTGAVQCEDCFGEQEKG
ncbi:MAG: hypothetical protein V2A71_00295 [Candidatus Eisenbacteria bacterium]